MEAMLIVNFLAGIVLGILIQRSIDRKTNHVGKMIVNKDEDKTVYSLELDVDPEKIQFKKKVFFSVENPDRE
jgi:hypothetical protein